MKKEAQKELFIGLCFLIAFILWTAALHFIDVQAIGPQESVVGFATINRFIHNLTGVHMKLYVITDWLGLVPICFVIGFAILGLVQWFQRKHILTVDPDILILGGFYIAVIGAYLLFEEFVVNYRPVLIGGILEASYPSSTTMLVMCVMPTSVMQLQKRIKNHIIRRVFIYAINFFTVFMVLGRMLSGVHWFSDIIGGALLSAALVILYQALTRVAVKKQFDSGVEKMMRRINYSVQF